MIKYNKKEDWESNKEILETYDFALKEMPYEFTTTDYIKVLRELKFSEKLITNQKHLSYLSKKCIRLTRNTFMKKINKSNQETPKKTETISFSGEFNPGNDPTDFENLMDIAFNSDEEKAVELLKKRGYVIFKPTFEKI